jgi:hypothetical protein
VGDDSETERRLERKSLRPRCRQQGGRGGVSVNNEDSEEGVGDDGLTIHIVNYGEGERAKDGRF